MNNKLRIRVGSEELRIEGSPEIIERERIAFYERIKNKNIKLRKNTKQKKDGECTISRTTMEEFSWEMIKAALNRNEVQYQVGDVVTSKLRNGNPQEWVITDIGKDYIRFEARDCIKDAEQRMNKEWTNAGGIALSEMQGYLDNEIWNLLPSDLQEVIATVDRKYMDGDEEKIYRTKLFLPSASEVFDENNCFGEENLYEQLNYYRDRHHRVKLNGFGGGSAYWWLSSPYSGNGTGFCTVTTAGAANYNNASSSFGVAPCFQIVSSES